jgi:hypothetical protein
MFVGYAAISEKIAAFHVNWPDCRLVLATGIVTFDNVVRLGMPSSGQMAWSAREARRYSPSRRMVAFTESFPFGRRSFRAFRNLGLRILVCRPGAR